MIPKAALTALVCAATLLVSGCDSEKAKDDQVNAYFSELMQRPDLEQMEADYLAMLERIQNKLVSDMGIKPFPPDDEEPISGSACPGDFSIVDDAEVRRYQFGASPGNISDADWPRALKLVTDVAGKQGFETVTPVIDKPGDHEVSITDRYGAELIFGTAKNTILSLSTGCHLTREAHQRGKPAEDKPLY